MSNFVLLWLRQNRDETAIIVDVGEPDLIAGAFFESVKDRVNFLAGDISDCQLWNSLPSGVSTIVHGAALTPAGEAEERAQAKRVVEVNVLGTVHALEWASRQEGLRRFIYVSTGGVYVDKDPRGAGLSLPEDGYLEPTPTTLYPISKLTSELLAKRFATLWSIPVVVVRLSSVYGPMDRPSVGRRLRCVPNVVCHLALDGKPIRVHGLSAVGDYICASDVASALAILARADSLEFSTYNIASGSIVSVEVILEEIRSLLPNTQWMPAKPQDADVAEDPNRSTGK